MVASGISFYTEAFKTFCEVVEFQFQQSEVNKNAIEEENLVKNQ
jgi:hypothetical protein